MGIERHRRWNDATGSSATSRQPQGAGAQWIATTAMARAKTMATTVLSTMVVKEQ